MGRDAQKSHFAIPGLGGAMAVRPSLGGLVCWEIIYGSHVAGAASQIYISGLSGAMWNSV